MLQAVLAQRRRAAAALPATARPRRAGGLLDAFDARLPFRLTGGQRDVGRDRSPPTWRASIPMHRLLQGEVGSGKTVVGAAGDAAGGRRRRPGRAAGPDRGARAAALPVDHRAARRRSARPGGWRRGTGDPGGAADRLAWRGRPPRGAARRRVRRGRDRHRHPRPARRSTCSSPTWAWWWSTSSTASASSSATRCGEGRARRPHVLVMTATPIPRTVAMTVYGDLETSTLTELPAGRSPIATHVVPAADKPRYLARAWERVREEVAAGPPGVRRVPPDRRGGRRRHGQRDGWPPTPIPTTRVRRGR